VGPQVTDDLSREIIEAENSSAWTLMHRFVYVYVYICSGAYVCCVYV